MPKEMISKMIVGFLFARYATKYERLVVARIYQHICVTNGISNGLLLYLSVSHFFVLLLLLLEFNQKIFAEWIISFTSICVIQYTLYSFVVKMLRLCIIVGCCVLCNVHPTLLFEAYFCAGVKLCGQNCVKWQMYEFHKDFTQRMMKKIVSFITKWLIECGIELQSSTKVKKKANQWNRWYGHQIH